jgi:hypothetical protein
MNAAGTWLENLDTWAYALLLGSAAVIAYAAVIIARYTSRDAGALAAAAHEPPVAGEGDSPPRQAAPGSGHPATGPTPRGRFTRRLKLPDGQVIDLYACWCACWWNPDARQFITYPCRAHEIEHWNWRLTQT